MSQKKIKNPVARARRKAEEVNKKIAERMFAGRVSQRAELLKRVTLVADQEDQQEEREEEEND